jgi:hypothetical protein
MFAGNVQIDEDVVKQGAASLTRFTEALELLSEGNSIEATALMGAANSTIEIRRLVQYLRTAVAGCSEAMGASVAFVRGCVTWIWVRKGFAPVQHFASYLAPLAMVRPANHRPYCTASVCRRFSRMKTGMLCSSPCWTQCALFR